jgi:hypothetical protein
MPRLRATKDQLGSPYLRDHADNPVEWWTWGEDAFEHARDLDRPIFLSVGYASCHWCHVMAHESFEDENVAKLLNDSFVAIKVDREERPDVDALYMAATQLVSGHGGWPMSVFLTPDGRPFMAGTYYPPVERNGQASFTRLLLAMHDAWSNQRGVVEEQADQLRDAVAKEVAFIDHLGVHASNLNLGASRRILRDDLVSRVDEFGGFGSAPKFPRGSYVEVLLEFDDEEARLAVSRTLDAMSRQGLYDHLRGGFARYSVDERWHVPHFEKMLSDQALLARTFLRASRARPDRPEWRDVALDTLYFVLSDLRVANGFASSLDADANGDEGSHVTWTPREVASALAHAHQDSEIARVLSRYRIVELGHFEGRSIPRLADDEPFRCPDTLRAAVEALRDARSKRVQPLRDEKVILEWNAMFASALLISDTPELTNEGLRLVDALHSSHFFHDTWWRTEHREVHATASDLAWLLDALVDAYEVTGDDSMLTRARELATYLLQHYWDGPVPRAQDPHLGRGFFSSSDLDTGLLLRPKEIFDGATPSSHAVACRAFARLSMCLDDDDLRCVSERLVSLATSLIEAHPGAVPDLLNAARFVREGIEIVVPGDANELSEHVRSLPMSHAVVVTGRGASPLLEGRHDGLAYVCQRGACRLPASNVEELKERLREVGA